MNHVNSDMLNVKKEDKDPVHKQKVDSLLINVDLARFSDFRFLGR